MSGATVDNARLIGLRARALALANDDAEQIKELEQAGLLWWFVAHRELDPNKRPPIQADQVEAGFFRISSGVHAPLVPAAVWRELDEAGKWTGELLASRGFRPTEPFELAELRKSWVWIAKKPIAYAEYAAALEAGEFSNPLVGDNKPPPEGIETLRETINEKIAEAMAWFRPHEKDGLPDQAAAEAAARLRDDLNKLWGAAEVEREAKTAPLYKTWQEALKEWAFAKPAKALADKLYAAIKVFADKERRRREEAARAAVLANKSIEDIAPAAPVVIRGTSRAVSLPKAKPRCRVTDHAAALAFVANRPAIKAAVEKEIQEIYEAGVEDIPGTKVERQAA